MIYNCAGRSHLFTQPHVRLLSYIRISSPFPEVSFHLTSPLYSPLPSYTLSLSRIWVARDNGACIGCCTRPPMHPHTNSASCWLLALSTARGQIRARQSIYTLLICHASLQLHFVFFLTCDWDLTHLQHSYWAHRTDKISLPIPTHPQFIARATVFLIGQIWYW
jgi:hypothetical protein